VQFLVVIFLAFSKKAHGAPATGKTAKAGQTRTKNPKAATGVSGSRVQVGGCTSAEWPSLLTQRGRPVLPDPKTVPKVLPRF